MSLAKSVKRLRAALLAQTSSGSEAQLAEQIGVREPGVAGDEVLEVAMASEEDAQETSYFVDLAFLWLAL